MLRSRKTIDPEATGAKLAELQAALQREIDNAESDPFDDAMVAVIGLVETMKAESVALAEAEVRQRKLARGK
ncbi:MAG: hypothetical protein ACRYGP_28475 [Janthinobacterium lividum]